jgi:hypothetical protein
MIVVCFIDIRQRIRIKFRPESSGIFRPAGRYFSDYLYQEGPNDITIVPTGDRNKDFSAANKLSGYRVTPKGYTWHHHQDYGRMQLVFEFRQNGPDAPAIRRAKSEQA